MGELTPEERPDPAGGYGKKVTAVMIGLKTTKGTKTLKLAPQIYDSLQKEKVTVGDVIYIEANSGVSRRVGRSDQYATESITREDIEEIDSLFFDAKSSAKLLAEQ